MATKRGKSQARRSSKSTRRGGVPGWLWLIAGLLLGLGLAGYLWWQGGLHDGRLLPRPDPHAKAPAVNRDAPVAQQGKTESKPAAPTYDFYTLLPEKEVIIPDAEIDEQAKASQPATPAANQRYVLQAAAFRSRADAEALKAKLAFAGLVAQVESEIIQGVTWHRVRLGPYADLRQLDSARSKLRQQGFDAIAIQAPKG